LESIIKLNLVVIFFPLSLHPASKKAKVLRKGIRIFLKMPKKISLFGEMKKVYIFALPNKKRVKKKSSLYHIFSFGFFKKPYSEVMLKYFFCSP